MQWRLLGSQVTGTVDQPVWSIESSPAHPTTLIEAVAGRGVLRSTDNGATWAVVLPSVEGAWTVHFDAQQPGVVYAGTYAEGFWKSADEGKTWTKAADGLDPDVRAIDSAPNLIAVGTAHGVYYSTDNATTWRSTGLASLDVAAVAIVASGSTTDILAGADNGSSGGYLLGLTDLNGSWSVVRGNFPADATVASLALGPTPAAGATGRTIFAGTSEGLYSSADSGVTWSQIGGLPQTDINAVMLNPGDSDQIYAASDGDQGQGGVFRSLDRGGTWSPLGQGLPKNPRVTALGLQPLSLLQVIASEWNPTTGQSGVYRFADQDAMVAGASGAPSITPSSRPTPAPTHRVPVSQSVPRSAPPIAWSNLAIAGGAVLLLVLMMAVRRWWMRREDARIYRR